MANGKDMDHFVVTTKVKKGLKREFEFAVKSQSEILGLTRRTRAGNGQEGGVGNERVSESSEKRMKVVEKDLNDDVVREAMEVGENGVGDSGSEESMKSEIEDPASDDERKSEGFSSQEEIMSKSRVSGDGEDSARVQAKPLQHYSRMKFKRKVTEVADGGYLNNDNSNSEPGPEVEKDGLVKVKLSKAPKLLKDFIDAGLFEGLRVKYIRSMKAKIAGEDCDIRGIIKGRGILCFCNKCRGTEVVSPHVFESHACSSNKRPPEYIFLENGKSLRDVMNACKDVPVDDIVESIRKATAPYPRETVTGSNCDPHTPVDQVTHGPRNAVMNYANRRGEKPASVEPLDVVTSKGSSTQSKPRGKITLKDLSLHRLVFEDDILPDGTEVTYVANKEVLRMGYKSGSGICCDCCNKVISPSQFEAHAGRASHRKPFHNIFTSNGVSLHELSLSLRLLNGNSVTDRDNLCRNCNKGGDLILCAGCPRSFHKECAHLPGKPDGTWYCRNCESNMKENHINGNALVAGRVPGVDSIEQIVNHCIRIINIGEVEIGGCIICRDQAFTKEFGPLTVIICEQCEREYHVGCLKKNGLADLTKEPVGDWFCCPECERINSSLHKLVAKGEERLPDDLLGAIKNKAKTLNDNASGSSFDVKWRILSGKMASEESRSLLATAVDILRENFGHIVDPSTNIDLIPAMVNGEELKIQDFRGMYCAVLTVNSAVVSAGVFRIRGQELAELPLVATSSQAHGQGYFQTLYACIERFFGFASVQKILLPAANGAEAIWTKKFGYSQMTEEELKPFMETYHLMNFQGLPWFKKSVPRVRILTRDICR